ncbi:MAG: divergent PAP2 family protein [Treponema sp.]
MQGFFVQLNTVFRNPIFLAAVSSWFLSQFIKTFIGFCASSVRTLPVFLDLMIWRTGGMPSSHTALVTALTTSIGFKQGVSSDLFIFSFFSAIIVIRDAMGVRRSSGIQAKTLNEVGAKLAEAMQVSFKPVKEIQGHTPVEVFAGIIVGILIGIYFSVFYTA